MSRKLYHGTSFEKADLIFESGCFLPSWFSDTKEISKTFAEVMFEVEFSDQILNGFENTQYGNSEYPIARQYRNKDRIKLADLKIKSIMW